MSTLEDYSVASQYYDSCRSAFGIHFIADAIRRRTDNRKLPKDIAILDAGCGTGNYANALFSLGFTNLTLLDASEDMLTKAKGKLSRLSPSRFHLHTLPDPMPFQSKTFDVVMFNFVLHHVEYNERMRSGFYDDSSTSAKSSFRKFNGWRSCLADAKRLLQPKDGLVILLSVTKSMRKSWWFHGFLPDHGFLSNYDLYPQPYDFCAIFREIGLSKDDLSPEFVINTNQLITTPETMYNFDILSKLDVIRTTSVFRFYTEDEIKDAAKNVEDMRKNNPEDFKKIVEKSEQHRLNHGQCVHVFVST